VLKWLFLIVILAGIAAAYVVLAPFGPSTEQFVDIAPHTSSPQIARQLQQAGIIRSAAAFEALRLARPGTLKAGEYRFDHPATPAEVYDRLRRGDVFTITLTIPEGYNLFDIDAAVAKAGLAQPGQFLAAARAHTDLIRSWSPQAPSLEGFLFPDTYRFSHHTTVEDMLAAMVRRFSVVATRLTLQPADAQRVVTLASLVEKEVHVDSERPTVAGVFQNRLAANMPLQTDPTVVYAAMLAGTWTGTIHQSDLHADSPYNTYVHTGLPPGPICNPGLAALQAALHPATTDFLYFVANPDGTTRFARTLDEHTANVAAYRAAIGGAPSAPPGQPLSGIPTAAPPDIPPPHGPKVTLRHPRPTHSAAKKHLASHR
jgi:UPF0755 protein